jgi:hypothetical protein
MPARRGNGHASERQHHAESVVEFVVVATTITVAMMLAVRKGSAWMTTTGQR